jgi:hypothetical protein
MEISLISIFRDESRYLKEWIEYHLLIGVDKFYLINNLSSDDYLSVLDPYVRTGVVTLVDLDVETQTGTHSRDNLVKLVEGVYPIFNKWIVESKSDWIIHLSTDEFLVPNTNKKLKDILNNLPSNVGQISVNWRLFGNSGISVNEGDLITEHLTKCSRIDLIDNLHTKFILRRIAYDRLPSVHYCLLKEN